MLAVDGIPPPDPSSKVAYVECQDCGARGPTVGNFNTPNFQKIAEDRWNTMRGGVKSPTA